MKLTRDQLTVERRITRSPIWIRAFDGFSGRRIAGGLEVTLKREEEGRWEKAVERPTFTSSGDIAFLGLGRAREPESIGTRPYLVKVNAIGYRTDYPLRPPPPPPLLPPPPGDGLLAYVVAWRPDRPPVAAAVLSSLPLRPAASYPFPPGTPLLNGLVQDAANEPVKDAHISAAVPALGVVEHVLTDERGWFRLPLRWMSGPTIIAAAKAGLVGNKQVNVPADLSSTHVITIS